ncbi:uncharacterized protein LOC128868662 [Anastrepha ludens]|uniref:uncharacterized protein LOC128868662 n=1 Tax=Anastrepha ludens TaxID=28586 RepID=UPI0023B07B8E|nr:uncharacterized protein LOC128868662 [Anastrepha ludens]XP_053966984.1 uncharacterized protein LOC128868662 [Anastrepha ludens]
MWLPMIALIFLVSSKGGVSCNKMKAINLSTNNDNQNNVAANNIRSGNKCDTQHMIVTAFDDVNYNNSNSIAVTTKDSSSNRKEDASISSYRSASKGRNLRTDDNDERSRKNDEMRKNHLYEASHDSSKITELDSVVDISWSNNNNSNNNVHIERPNSYSGKLSLSNAAQSSFRTLPRHQRAIAAVAEQKGLLQAAGDERVLRRGKRYLQFAKGSRVSWRTNGKNNILKSNTLWAYGYGFRVNFPFPGPDESRRPFFKRDVLHSLVDVLDGHGLDGQACILKSYCTAALDVNSNISGGMLFKMLKLIFTLKEHDKRHLPYLRLENCKQILHSHCPLSFNSISPYTDDV